MAAEKYLVDPLTIGFDLTLYLGWEIALPKRALVGEETLQLGVRRFTWIGKELQASHAAVAVKDDKLSAIWRDERHFKDLAFFDDVLCQVAHVCFTRIEQPRDRGCFILQFPMSIIGAVDQEIDDLDRLYAHDPPDQRNTILEKYCFGSTYIAEIFSLG